MRLELLWLHGFKLYTFIITVYTIPIFLLSWESREDGRSKD